MNKKRIWEILEKANKGDKQSKFFDIFISILILTNIIAIILESVPELSIYKKFFNLFEVFSIIIFTIEYLLRFYSCSTIRKYKGIKGRVKYIFSFMAIIDLFAILPFYLPMFFSVDLRILRIFRTFRIFRLFKLGRYSKAINAFLTVFKTKKQDLAISLIISLFLLLIASTLMYSIENKVQPDSFKSIPHTMWWGVATLTTVGYGDIYPITPAGKLLASIMAILGIGLFALPAGIVASGYQEVHEKEQKEIICPHCNKKIK